MASSPLSPSGECEGEKTELSPLSPLKGMRGDKRGALGVRGGRDTKPYEAISLMQEVVASAEPMPVRIAMISFIQKLMFAFLSSFMVL